MRRILPLVPALVLACSACTRQEARILGKPPAGQVETILAVRDGITPPDVTLRGTLVEKCPTAGCWFILKDRTGLIKVDTKAAGFAVTGIPLETDVTVSGRLAYHDDAATLTASGLKY